MDAVGGPHPRVHRGGLDNNDEFSEGVSETLDAVELVFMTLIMLAAIAAVETAFSLLISRRYLTVAPDEIKLHVLDLLLEQHSISSPALRSEGRGACRPPPKWALFTLNAAMHVMILTCILTAIFFVVIVPAERKALQKEFGKAIDEGLRPLIEPGGGLHEYLARVPIDVLQRLRDGTANAPDHALDEINDRTLTLAVTMCVLSVWCSP